MLLKACLNGPRLPAEHPRLPVTPGELAADVVAVAAAGAGAVHLHVKDAEGRDTFGATELAAAVLAIRHVSPLLPVGVTTGAWAEPDPTARVAAVRRWAEPPDFASVNWHEDGADDVAQALLDNGIGVEAGLWHEGAVRAWIQSPHRDRCLRVMVELPDGLDGEATVAVADRLLALVGRPSAPVLLHGEGSSAWPALRHAGRLGLDARIGLEDTLVLPDGSPAPDNAALVRAAAELLG